MYYLRNVTTGRIHKARPLPYVLQRMRCWATCETYGIYDLISLTSLAGQTLCKKCFREYYSKYTFEIPKLFPPNGLLDCPEEKQMTTKSGADLLKALMETPLNYKGEIVYITEIDSRGNSVGIGPRPYYGTSAWHNPSEMFIAKGEPVKYFSGLEELLDPDFIKANGGRLKVESLTPSQREELSRRLKDFWETHFGGDWDDPEEFDGYLYTDEFEEGYPEVINEFARLLRKLCG